MTNFIKSTTNNFIYVQTVAGSKPTVQEVIPAASADSQFRIPFDDEISPENYKSRSLINGQAKPTDDKLNFMTSNGSKLLLPHELTHNKVTPTTDFTSSYKTPRPHAAERESRPKKVVRNIPESASLYNQGTQSYASNSYQPASYGGGDNSHLSCTCYPAMPYYGQSGYPMMYYGYPQSYGSYMPTIPPMQGQQFGEYGQNMQGSPQNIQSGHNYPGNALMIND